MRKVWFVLLVCVVMVGCRTLPEPEPVRVERDSIYLRSVERDSVFVRDSVLIREKGDTVYRDRWRVEYRERVLRDTAWIERNDTITNMVEVEKALTWWERTRMAAGDVALLVLVVLLIYMILRHGKKVFWR